MSALSPAPRGSLPPGLWLHVDDVCDRFEEAWKTGRRPRLEDFVADVVQPERGLLVGELLAVELAYRRRHGESPTSQEYVVRFPECAADVCDVFLRNGESDLGFGAPIAHGAPAPLPGGRSTAPPETLNCLPGQGEGADTPAGLDLTNCQRVGDYALLEPIGHGGMGIVYRAMQGRLGRIVAVKVIHPDRLRDLSPQKRGRWLQRFRREARLTAQIDHDHVVALYDVDEQDGQPFYSMRYINGKPLSELIKQGPLAGRQAAAFLEPIARAVHRAHECGILHRDLKPRNILIDALQRPYLTDFGLACWSAEAQEQPADDLTPIHDPDDALTPAGECLGTPSYMSPEQIRDATQIGPAAEVYSLGATLYEMLTGKPPFQGKTHRQTLEQVLLDDLVPPRQRNRAVPRDLETITLKCLHKEPSARYPSAARLADDLRHFLNGEPIEARRASLPDRFWRWCKRAPTLAAVSGLAAAAVLLLAVVGVIQERNAQRRLQQRRATEALETALGHCERGEIAVGLNWLARSLELAPADDQDLQRVVRRNLDAWSRQSVWLGKPPVRHPRKVSAAAVSPDGTTFITGDEHGWLRYWKIRSGELVREVEGLDGKNIAALTCSSDGKWCVWAGTDRLVRVWDIATGEEVKRVNPGFLVADLALSPDAKTLLARAETTKSVILLDMATGSELVRYEPPEGVEAMAFFPNGQSVLTSSSKNNLSILRTWDLAGNTSPEKDIRLPRPTQFLAISPDGNKVLAAGNEGIWVLDQRTNDLTEMSLSHPGQVRGAALGVSRATILTLGDERTTRITEFPLAKDQTTALGHRWSVTGLAVSKDRTLAATSVHAVKGRRPAGGGLQVWDLIARKPLSEPLAHPEWILGLAISPDGRTLAAGGQNFQVELRQLPRGELRAQLPHGNHVSKVEFSPDGQLLLCAGAESVVRVWNVSTAKELFQLGHTKQVRMAAFSPDGERIVTGSTDGTAVLWSAKTGVPLSAPLQHGGEVHFVAFSPSGQTFLTAGHEPCVHIWDTATATRLHTCLGHQGAIRCVAFTPDGRLFITGSADRTVRIWDATNGQQIGAPLGHVSPISMVAPSPDGTMLLVGSMDRVARLWDVAAGKPLSPSLKHLDPVYESVFAPDGLGFWTLGNGNRVRFWRIPEALPGQPERIRLWCQVLTRMELDAGGAIRPLDEAAWNERRQQMEKAGGPPL